MPMRPFAAYFFFQTYRSSEVKIDSLPILSAAQLADGFVTGDSTDDQ